MTVLGVGAWGLEDIRTVDIENIEAECEIREADTTTQSAIPEQTTQSVMGINDTGVDIKMIIPQMSPEILVCGMAGVIFFVSLLVIIIFSIRNRLNSQKKHAVAFTKLEALPMFRNY